MFSDAESTAPGLAASTLSAPDSSQTLQDRQIRLMILEQQNKKLLLQARREQDNNKPNEVDLNPGGAQANLPQVYAQSQARERQRQAQENFPSFTWPKTPIDNDGNYKADQIGADLSAQDGHAKTIFTISDEFIYMFSKCRSSDVLQILRDNWHHYSQWISGLHMSWQDPEFVVSSGKLTYQIGSCAVRSAIRTMPLRETVLPAIDRQLDRRLDQRCLIPAVEIIDPQDANWRFLGSFGVVLIADVHYYLRCLIAISEQDRADIDQVAYIYDKIQSFYRGSEPMIQYVYFPVQGFGGAKQISVRHFLGEN
jgi:hypothetical protein